jgi:Protein of unknown function (DUF3147)
VKVQFNLATLGRSKWYEYAVRFAFGGAVTVLAGLIAKECGPEIGGLFLAFPAIFPATATLLEKHEKQKKPNPLRARQVAGIDAAGASMGSLGLIAFAIVVWQGLPRYALIGVLATALMAWLLVAVVVWWLRKTWLRNLRLQWRRHATSENKEVQ